MDSNKYDVLKTSFIHCLYLKKSAVFKDFLADVTADLKNKNIAIKGVIEWNLFWVTLDMEPRNVLEKDKTKSPYSYSIKPLI